MSVYTNPNLTVKDILVNCKFNQVLNSFETIKFSILNKCEIGKF